VTILEAGSRVRSIPQPLGQSDSVGSKTSFWIASALTLILAISSAVLWPGGHVVDLR